MTGAQFTALNTLRKYVADARVSVRANRPVGGADLSTAQAAYDVTFQADLDTAVGVFNTAWGSSILVTPSAATTLDGDLALLDEISAQIGSFERTLGGAPSFNVVDGDFPVKFADTVKLSFGDGDDITFVWNGTKFVAEQATVNSAIELGVDGAGIDFKLFGDTASAYALWDQSADALILGGVAKIKLQTIAAATGTAIPVTHSGSFPITQNGAETNTLAIPTFLGQQLDIFVDTDTSGARVITSAQRINQAGNTIITMTEVGDFIRLVAISIGGALRWQVVANDGCVLS